VAVGVVVGVGVAEGVTVAVGVGVDVGVAVGVGVTEGVALTVAIAFGVLGDGSAAAGDSEVIGAEFVVGGVGDGSSAGPICCSVSNASGTVTTCPGLSSAPPETCALEALSASAGGGATSVGVCKSLVTCGSGAGG
jgi:hypothetical protein